MTSKLFKSILLRTFSTKCLPTPIGGTPNYSIQNTTLPNKIVVSSAENESPISIISIIYRAGTRNEPPDTPGLVHTLQTCGLVTTKNATEFAITRNVQQHGARLFCRAHRQLIVYTLQGTRAAIEKTLPFLTEVATNQIYQPWDVSDNVSRQKEFLKFLSPFSKVRDLVHKAAYRKGGLGNSLYIPYYNLGKISVESLQHFVKNNFTTGRTVVAALGVDHGMLLKFVSTLKLEPGDPDHPPAPYIGGEIREETGGSTTYVALALPGLCHTFQNLIISHIIKRALFGTTTPKSRCRRYGNVGNSPCTILGKLVKETCEPVQIIPYQYCYSDAGLIGVLIGTSKDLAGKLVEVAAKTLKTTTLEEEEFKRAKATTKAEFLISCESPSSALDFIGRQGAYEEFTHSIEELEETIDGVTLDDVLAALKQAAEGKMSMAALGNLQTVPFLDELNKDSC